MSRSDSLRGNLSGRSRLVGVLLSVAIGLLAALLAFAATASAASAPSIEGESVSNITEHDATLEATINPKGLKTTYQFRLESGCLPPAACLAITSYPLPSAEIPASFEAQQVTLDLNSANVTLHPDTRYRYNIEATNSAGSAQGEGEGQIFTTPPAWHAPRIEAESVSNITPTDATLEAKINTEGLETTYGFRLAERWACEEAEPACLRPGLVTIWGLPSGKLLGSFAIQTVSLDLNSAGVTLSPGHDFYEYSVSATNSAGFGEGQPQHFTTPSQTGVEPLTQPNGGADPQSSTAIPPPTPMPGVLAHRRHRHRHHRGRPHRRSSLRAPARSRTVVAYTEEQSGIVFRHTSLLLTTRGQATVRFESCVRRLHLGAALWNRLNAALKRTDMHAVAGNHVPATPHAEESTWVIVVGHDTVRITAHSIPPELRARLKPLLKTVEEVVSVGKRRMPQSCSSKRTVNGTG